MGRQLRDDHSDGSFRSGHPRCNWNLLNLIKYQHWHSIMKILVHRGRHGVDNHVSREDDSENGLAASTSNKLRHQKDAENEVQDEGSKSSVSTKSSVKGRIKSRIAEEISRRKGKHQKRSANQARSTLSRTDSFHRLKNSVFDPLNGSIVSDERPLVSRDKNNENSPVATSEEFDSQNKSPEHNQVSENGKQVLGVQKFGSSVKDLVRDDLDHHSKEFQDVFDTTNVNKLLLLTMLHNPGAPLVNHFNRNKDLGGRMGLTKSETFPALHLAGQSIAGPSKLKDNQEKFRVQGADEEKLLNEDQPREDHLEKPAMPSMEEHEREMNLKPSLLSSESAGSYFPSSSHYIKNHSENQMVVRRFKDLRNKIKHVIKAGKKERHRITRDAIFHKIPHGHGYSKALKKPICSKTKDSAANGEARYSPVSGHEIEHYIGRTLSLNESLDRYCQLYETSFNQEGKQYKSVGLQFTPQGAEFSSKSLGRIYSMPDLKSYFYHREDSIDTFSSPIMKKTVEHDRDIVITSTAEQSNAQEILGKFKEVDEASREEEISGSISNFETTGKSIPIEDEASSIDAPEADCSKDLDLESKTGTISEQEQRYFADTIKEVELNNGLSYQFLEVEEKDRADYNYVRDVLELSGLGGNGLFLDTWHSKDQPVDPSIFDQVEGCWVLDPDCAGNEEGGECDHLLLFDLINEVLIEIFCRAHRNRSMPLLSVPYNRSMLKGRHILKQVWDLISWYSSFLPQAEHSIDHVVSRDIEKGNGWLDLLFDVEIVGVELQDLILDDLLEEAIWT